MVPILCFAFLHAFLASSHKIAVDQDPVLDLQQLKAVAKDGISLKKQSELVAQQVEGLTTTSQPQSGQLSLAETPGKKHGGNVAGHGNHDETAGHGQHKDMTSGHDHDKETEGHSSHAEGHGHGHHAPDTTTSVASYMLIGGVTIVIALFYLVQHPDLDIRFYSWNILTLSMCIFISVLITDMVNTFVKHAFFEHVETGNVNYMWMCAALSLAWFVASQAVCAWLSGAFGEEAKEPSDAESEEERKELEALWKEREVALKCWGGLVAHCAGFSIIATLAAVQDTHFFSSSPGKSLLVVPLAMALVLLFYKLAAFVRRQISLMDDGEVSKGEDLWDDCSAQAENEALCLGLSFACMRSVFFFTFGAMPDGHGHVSHGSVSDETWQFGWKILWAISLMCIASGLGTAVLKDKIYGGDTHEEDGAHGESEEHGDQGKHSEKATKVEHVEKTKHGLHGEEGEKNKEEEHDEEEEKEADEDEMLGPRSLSILSETLIFAFAWGMLFSATACLNANLAQLQFHLAGHLIVALCLSGASCLMVLCLDKVADVLKNQAGNAAMVHMLNHIIGANGVLIGIAWEICFALSVHAIGFDLNHFGKNVTLVLIALLILVVVPAYRLFMLPELNTRREKVGHH